MTISKILRRELNKRGLTVLNQAARYLGVSTELLRVTLSGKHIPKDKTLEKIAGRLGLDMSSLVLAAHRQKLPKDVQGLFLAPVQLPEEKNQIRRKWPLSQEQCEYLSSIMTSEEIQLIRKYRQLREDQKAQLLGYLHYRFAMARQALAQAAPSTPSTEPAVQQPAEISALVQPASAAGSADDLGAAGRPPVYGPRPLILKNA
jgi:transcriptional regulator with XRE-family HTH domain